MPLPAHLSGSRCSSRGTRPHPPAYCIPRTAAVSTKGQQGAARNSTACSSSSRPMRFRASLTPRPIFISTFVSASLHVHRRFLRPGLDALLLSLSLSPSILFPPRSHGPCTKGSKGEKRTWCQYTQGTVRGETLWDPG